MPHIPAGAERRDEENSGRFMDAIINMLREERATKGLKSLSVVAVHEDFATGARVGEVCRTLAGELGGGCEVVNQPWLVNLLRLPRLRAIAAEDAAAADVVIVSLHDAGEFPIELKDWVEAWLQQKRDHPKVLLALFDEDGGQTAGLLQAYLEAAAQRGGLAFFLQPYEPAASPGYLRG